MSDRAWRNITGEDLRAFVRGKTVADAEDDGFSTTTTFTDGSAIRCTAQDGTVYSSYSADPANISWEASPAP